MSMKEREGDGGGDERCVKIDRDIMKRNSWKSLKEMKEYLRTSSKKSHLYRTEGNIFAFRCLSGRC